MGAEGELRTLGSLCGIRLMSTHSSCPLPLPGVSGANSEVLAAGETWEILLVSQGLFGKRHNMAKVPEIRHKDVQDHCGRLERRSRDAQVGTGPRGSLGLVMEIPKRK